MKGNTTARPDPWPALLLVLGFTATATATFAVLWALGTGLLGDRRSGPVVWWVAACVLMVLFVADGRWLGLRTPMWRRQTPKWFMYRFSDRTAALLWGIDAGIVGTTFRVTSLSWAALVLTFVGLLPWWAGVVFAFGFVVPQLIANLLIPRRIDPTGDTDPEPGWLVDRLHRLRPAMRPVGLTLLAAASVWTVLLSTQ